MIGKITSIGELKIIRGGQWRKQMCPFVLDPGGEYSSATYLPCGDWCPLFGEPKWHHIPEVKLQLCHKIISFDEFIDDRKEEETSE